jgi:hypothetical protein
MSTVWAHHFIGQIEFSCPLHGTVLFCGTHALGTFPSILFTFYGLILLLVFRFLWFELVTAGVGTASKTGVFCSCLTHYYWSGYFVHMEHFWFCDSYIILLGYVDGCPGLLGLQGIQPRISSRRMAWNTVKSLFSWGCNLKNYLCRGYQQPFAEW